MSRLLEAMKRARAAGSAPLDEVGEVERLGAEAALTFVDPFGIESVVEAPRTSPRTTRTTAASHARHSSRAATAVSRPSASADPASRHMVGLVQRIFLAPDRGETAVRSVMFAAVQPTDVPALLSVPCAEVLLDHLAGSVCLVDANFAAPSLHRRYGIANDRGLSDALRELAPIASYATRLAETADRSLWVLPAGSSWDAAGTLFTAEATRSRFQDVLQAFDYVIVEAPSVSQQPAFSMLGAQVDGVVLVVEANVTRRHVARATADNVRASGARVLGTVLNNRTFPIPDAIYRHL